MRIDNILWPNCDRKGKQRKPTGSTLSHGHLLYAGVVPAGCHLHLAVVGVDVPVGAAHGLPVVAAVPRAQALLQVLVLQAPKDVVARARVDKAWEFNRASQFCSARGRRKGNIAPVLVFMFNSLRFLRGIYKFDRVKSFGNEGGFFKEPWCNSFLTWEKANFFGHRAQKGTQGFWGKLFLSGTREIVQPFSCGAPLQNTEEKENQIAR